MISLPSLTKRYNHLKKVVVVWFILVFLTILGSTLVYQRQKKHNLMHQKDDIKELAEIKIKQFVNWHHARMADVNLFSQCPYVANTLSAWLSHTSNDELKAIIEERIKLSNANDIYANIIITDTDGKILINQGKPLEYLDDTTLDFVKKSVATGESLFTDFYQCQLHSTTHIDYIAPIKNSSNRVNAVIIFRINLDEDIYSLLDKQLTGARMVNSFIFRIEDDSLVFLRGLEGMVIPDKSMKKLLDHGSFPGFGETYNVENEKLLAYVAPVGINNWFFITVVEYKEIYNAIAANLLITTFVTILLIIFLSLGVFTHHYYLRKTAFLHSLMEERKLSSYYREFHTILSSVADGIVTTDLNGIVVKMNSKAETLLGISEIDSIGQPINKITQQLLGFDNLVSDVLIQQRTLEVNIEIPVKHEATPIVYASVSASPIYNENNVLQGVVLTLHDNTNSTLSAIKIAESEKRYKMLFDNMAQGFALHNLVTDSNGEPKDFLFTDINKTFEEITGLKKEKVLGHTMLELTPNIEQEWIRTLGKIALGGEPLHFQEYYEQYDKHLVSIAFCPQPGQLAILSSDNTKRWKAEQEVHQKNEFIQTVLDNLPVGIALNSISNGNVTYTNKRFEEIYGWTKEEISNTAVFFEKVFPEKGYRDEISKRILEDLGSGDPNRMKWDNVIITQKDGGHRVINAVNIPMSKQDTMVSTVIDITDIKQAEEAVHEGEALFSSLFYNNNSVMIIVDPKTQTLIDVNQAAERFYGWSRNEMIGMSVSEINMLSTNKVGSILQDVSAQGKATHNLQHRIKGGAVRDVEVIASRITLKKKHYIHAIVYEVTQKKQYEEQVFKLTKGIEHSPAGVVMTDANGLVEYVNPKFEQISGYSLKEVIGTDLSFLNPDIESKEIFNQLRDTVSSGNIWSGEMLCRRKNGEPYWRSTSVSPIKDDTGKVKSVIAVSIDITEKKQAELQIQKLSKGVEQSPASIVITNTDGKIEFVNPKFMEITGYSREDVLGLDLKFLNSGKEPESFYDDLWNTIKAGNDWRGEMLNKKKNGELYWESTHISPVKDEKNRIVNFIAIKEDITQRKLTELELHERDLRLQEQNEEYMAINEELKESYQKIKVINEELEEVRKIAEENDRLKSAFLANMSHEIRTPMNAICGFSNLLLNKSLGEEEKEEFVHIINVNSQQLLSIINDIIDVSKIEAGQVTISKIDFSLNNLLNDLQLLFRQPVRMKGIQYSTTYGLSNEQSKINSDELKLKQILSNLIYNAIKFTSKGFIEVGYTLKNGFIEFFVRDTGIGIDTRDFKRIFGRFQQVEKATTESRTGTGLGLPICKAYVELLGGKIWLTSTVGEGSIFYFTIPYDSSEAQVYEAIRTEGEVYNWHGKTILIAEDDTTNYLYLREVIGITKATIFRAKNGEEVLDACSNTHFDLILMDIKMPLMDGVEATKILRSRGNQIPIIAQTAYAFSEDKQKMLNSGFNDYISKPIRKEELLWLMGKWLNNPKNS